MLRLGGRARKSTSRLKMVLLRLCGMHPQTVIGTGSLKKTSMSSIIKTKKESDPLQQIDCLSIGSVARPLQKASARNFDLRYYPFSFPLSSHITSFRFVYKALVA